jgi:fumarate reductase subunit C
VQRKFLTFVRECFGGWLNSRTYILKPFLLQEIINVILDWFRVFLIVGLAQRNMISLMVCFAVFYSLLYVEVVVRRARTCAASVSIAHAR